MRLFLGLLLFAAYLLFGRWYWVCEVRQLCAEEVEIAPTRAKTMQLTEGDTIILDGYEQFDFPMNARTPDLTDNNREFLDAVAQYLKDNPDKNVRLSVGMRPEEANTRAGIFENIALARASWLENYFSEQGIDPDRIFPDHRTLRSADDPFVTFDLFIPEDRPEDYNQIGVDFMNMTYSDANFEFNSAVFDPGEAAIAYLDSVKIFLTENPDHRLMIVGHTDSIASQKYNYELGLKRAENAKLYLIDLEVTAPIDIDSKGKLEPVAANNSEEGRQRNRRVNFVLRPTDEEEQ